MIINAIIILAGIGVIASVILFIVSRQFMVEEDHRIDMVEEVLPSANCGGCGFAGCRNFAEAIVKAGKLEGFNCPVGGQEVMSQVAQVLGWESVALEPQIAVVRCNGTIHNAPKKNVYNGSHSCAVVHYLYAGQNGCPYGCLGCGDCVRACTFDAIYMGEEGLPVVKDNCVACGACVKACPRNIIELRPRGKKEKRIYVQCVNREKGVYSRQHCSVSCIGCNKCVKVCPHDAITLTENLAYIHADKCKLCRKCVAECPTGAINEVNFPPRKINKDVPEKSGVSV